MPSTAAPVVAIAAGDGAALKAHLAKPPAGAKARSVANSTGGVETLDQFVKNLYPDSSNEKGIMQTRGFQVAAESEWQGSDGVIVDTVLVQFGDADGAESYVTSAHSAYLDDKTIATSYALAGLDHGYGYERSAMDKYGDRQAILACQMGPIVVLMFVYTPGQFDRAAERATLQRQVTALTP